LLNTILEIQKSVKTTLEIQKVKMASWTIYHFQCRFDQSPILGIWLCKIAQWIYFTTSVQTDSVKVESVVHGGQRIPLLEMVVTLWHIHYF